MIDIGKDKVDLVDMYRNYSVDKSIDIAEYCIHDTVLCRHLFTHLFTLYIIESRSTSFYLPQENILLYHSSTTIKGPIAKILIDDKKIYIRHLSESYNCKYQGAVVFESKYRIIDNIVCSHDFNSLYPNTLIWFNGSPEKVLAVYKIQNPIKSDQLLRRFRDCNKDSLIPIKIDGDEYDRP